MPVMDCLPSAPFPYRPKRRVRQGDTKGKDLLKPLSHYLLSGGEDHAGVIVCETDFGTHG